MVALPILKQMFKESDETVVVRWTENPYCQYFSGTEYFQWQLPCDPAELTKFIQSCVLKCNIQIKEKRH